jgi:hypothetical protein
MAVLVRILMMSGFSRSGRRIMTAIDARMCHWWGYRTTDVPLVGP